LFASSIAARKVQSPSEVAQTPLIAASAPSPVLSTTNVATKPLGVTADARDAPESRSSSSGWHPRSPSVRAGEPRFQRGRVYGIATVPSWAQRPMGGP
jgi:hypothetical protein